MYLLVITYIFFGLFCIDTIKASHLSNSENELFKVG